MLKIIISGCNGHMGRVVTSLCEADPQVQVVAGFDVLGASDREFPVYSSLPNFMEKRMLSLIFPLRPRWMVCCPLPGIPEFP